MFDSLTEKLESIFRKLKGRGLLKEEDVDAALKEVRLALLEADVNFRVVKILFLKLKRRQSAKKFLKALLRGSRS